MDQDQTKTSRLATVRAAYEAFGQGDFGPFTALLHENVEWHIPGTSPYAGTTRSRDELFSRMLAQYQASGGTTVLEWVDGIGSGPLVVVLERLRASREGRSLDVGAAVVYRFDGDQVVEAHDVFDDQRAYDAFWSE